MPRRAARIDADRPTRPRILLASEGRRIPGAAVELAAALARQRSTEVRVFSIARIHGTSLGLPMPGLLPSKREWDEQREIAHAAVRTLRRQGIAASARVVGTRRAGKRIVQEAMALGCDTIVMGADPRRSVLVADFLWSQEPYRVRRRGARAGLEVRLVDVG